MEKFDKIIIGAGLYGLYSALFCVRRGQRVVVLECDSTPFRRATYINQARVHQGYHYPRSISTAMKSAGYFERFNKDYAFCVNKEFDQIYATSSEYSWSNGRILAIKHLIRHKDKQDKRRENQLTVLRRLANKE